MRGSRLHVVLAVVTFLGLLLVYLSVSGFNSSLAEQISQLSSAAHRASSRNFTDLAPPYLVPSDDELTKMDEPQMMHVYWKYINMLQTLCYDIVRIGSLQDGGKEICIDPEFKPQAPCLVYSFGINDQWDFDNHIVNKFGCEVHCFDPSMKRQTSRINEFIWFYKWGLGAENKVTPQGWAIKTLDQIRKELGHTNRTIDILKIDIEGAEWASIPQMISSGALDDVKQISMETHFAQNTPTATVYWGGVKPAFQLRSLRLLYEAGFRIFMRERNMWNHQSWPTFKVKITNVNEISVIRKPKGPA